MIANLYNTSADMQLFHKARLAELADALDLGSSAARRGGSTPLSRTLMIIKIIMIKSTIKLIHKLNS